MHRRIALALPLLLLVSPELRAAEKASAAEVKARAAVMRRAIQANRQLRVLRPHFKVPRSGYLAPEATGNKSYGDSWMCHLSSCTLLEVMRGAGGPRLILDSVGRGAFPRWGSWDDPVIFPEGYPAPPRHADGSCDVDLHYFLSSAEGKKLLLDATATSNFAIDVSPGGMVGHFVREVGREMGQARAAERVIERIRRGGVRGGGLLVLAHDAEIAVYREGLERVHTYRTQLLRDQERADR